MVEEVEANCTEPGNVEYWLCRNCERAFSLAIGIIVI